VLVRSPDSRKLQSLLTGPDVGLIESGPELLEVSGLSAPQIGDLAAAHGIAIHELTPQRASLEEAFMKLTNDAIEFHGGTTSDMTSGIRVAA
jgi:ABC-2 type transport system ATP-binding protein